MNVAVDAQALTAFSPLDGRYATLIKSMQQDFSEFALIKERVLVEVRWLRFLIDRLPATLGRDGQTLTQQDSRRVSSAVQPFVVLAAHVFLGPIPEFLDRLESCTLQEACEIKKIELETHHDVKAVELYVQRCLQAAFDNKEISSALVSWKEYVHLGCTSEDINNVAYALMIKKSIKKDLRPRFVTLIQSLVALAKEGHDTPMLSLTHGQPAVPTTFGKEIALFSHRLARQLSLLDEVVIQAKFNGAVGNFNAHCFIYPDLSWPQLAKEFIQSFDLAYQPFSTQIEPHDYIAELCHVLLRFHTICLDAVQDLWGYISRDYLRLKANPSEVGSSTMPHKVNPIHFENAEGNLGLSNALLEFFAKKLCVSRMQRDLSDSTVLRNLSLALGYSYLAVHSFQQGLSRIQMHHQRIADDLNQHWEILAEPCQIYLRSENVSDAYQRLKAKTRGMRSMNQEAYNELIQSLEPHLSKEGLKTIKNLHPFHYLGRAVQLTKEMIHQVEQKL